jgi:FixJ family two-component response regulator
MAKLLRPNESNERPTVVLVDDDAAVLTSLKFALELEGFTVAAYANAEDLLADGVKTASCFVVDYHLPGANGLELLSRLRQRGYSTPVILITSNPTRLLTNRAREAGAAIVEKPLIGNNLIDAIRASVNQ